MLLVVTGVLFLYNWVEEAVALAHVMPRVEWCDITPIVRDLQKGASEITEDMQTSFSQLGLGEQEAVALLAAQTGLCEESVTTLIGQGRAQELFKLQEIYFAPVEIEAIRTTPLTVSEWLVKEPVSGYEGMPMADIRDGDILITKNSRFLGWRNGHAGLVVDADKGLVLEALMLGSPSQLCRISKWKSYPSFMVLRLKEEFGKGTKTAGESTAEGTDRTVMTNITADVASYAEEQLVGVPYQLLAGILGRDAYRGEEALAGDGAFGPSEVVGEALTGTQCAHLVWYAYMQFGINLDSDGGLFVTPYDIQNSPYLEVVQVYGY